MRIVVIDARDGSGARRHRYCNWVWRRYIASGEWNAAAWPPFGLWLAAIVYLAVPFTAGIFSGMFAVRTRRDAAPRARDAFFAAQVDGWLRIRMRSGYWIAGAFGADAFASSYREKRDLFLPSAVEVDEATGAIVRDANRIPQVRAQALYVNAEEVEFFEFVER